VACVIDLARRPIFLSGRYLKLCRGVSQTQWIINGVRRGIGSVEECISNVVSRYHEVTTPAASVTVASGLTHARCVARFASDLGRKGKVGRSA
jgi:tRNA U54 and U55 pseudouridine synthase Pus10